MGGKRNRATLEPIIVEHIKPGSIIISDQWPAYNNIPNLVDSDGVSLNYEHHTINHSERFVDAWVHTQTIERFWGDLKEIVKRRGVHKKVDQHLNRLLFLKKHPTNTLHHLMIEAGKSFPFSVTEP